MSSPDDSSVEAPRRRPRFVGVRIAILVIIVVLWIQAIFAWRQLGYRWETVEVAPTPEVAIVRLEPRTPFGETLEVVAVGRIVLWERPADPDDPLLLLRAVGPDREKGARLVRTEDLGHDGGFATVGVATEREGKWVWLEGEAARRFLEEDALSDDRAGDDGAGTLEAGSPDSGD